MFSNSSEAFGDLQVSVLEGARVCVYGRTLVHLNGWSQVKCVLCYKGVC